MENKFCEKCGGMVCQKCKNHGYPRPNGDGVFCDYCYAFFKTGIYRKRDRPDMGIIPEIAEFNAP